MSETPRKSALRQRIAQASETPIENAKGSWELGHDALDDAVVGLSALETNNGEATGAAENTDLAAVSTKNLTAIRSLLEKRLAEMERMAEGAEIARQAVVDARAALLAIEDPPPYQTRPVRTADQTEEQWTTARGSWQRDENTRQASHTSSEQAAQTAEERLDLAMTEAAVIFEEISGEPPWSPTVPGGAAGGSGVNAPGGLPVVGGGGVGQPGPATVPGAPPAGAPSPGGAPPVQAPGGPTVPGGPVTGPGSGGPAAVPGGPSAFPTAPVPGGVGDPVAVSGAAGAGAGFPAAGVIGGLGAVAGGAALAAGAVRGAARAAGSAPVRAIGSSMRGAGAARGALGAGAGGSRAMAAGGAGGRGSGGRGGAGGRGGGGARGAGAAAGAGGRGGRSKDKGSRKGEAIFEDAEQWLDDEDAGPGVIR